MIVWRHLSNFKDTFVFTRYSQQKHMLIFFAFCFLQISLGGFTGFFFEDLLFKWDAPDVLAVGCRVRSFLRLRDSFLSLFYQDFFFFSFRIVWIYLGFCPFLVCAATCTHKTLYTAMCVCACVCFVFPLKKRKKKKNNLLSHRSFTKELSYVPPSKASTPSLASV